MRALSIPRIVIPLLLGLVFVTPSADAASLTAWELTTPLPVALAGHAMTATTTHVYVLGGVRGTNCTLMARSSLRRFSRRGASGLRVRRRP